MRLITSVVLLLIAQVVMADRVIPPNVPMHISELREERRPVFDRSSARELLRMRVDPFVLAEESGVIADGEVQALARPLRIDLPRSPAMIGRITVDGARATRLRFRDVPEGTVLWLAGSEDEELIRFEPSAIAEWGPTTRGSTVFLAGEGSGAIEVVELANVAAMPEAQSSCLSDVACRTSEDFADLADASRAIGYIRFVRDGKSHVCTGGLLNDAASSGTPYLLTARHCISTQQEAASVEVVWDLRSEACGSNRMAQVSRSHGATLLAASSKSDVALLKLSSVPEGRVFLGIDTRSPAPETTLHRVSHAGGLSQTYSSAVVDENAMTCPGAERPQYVYTRLRVGATSGGSSGAPLLLPGLYVVGQLRGTCGADPANSCATFNAGVDGSLRAAWPLLAPHLDPGWNVRRRAVR